MGSKLKFRIAVAVMAFIFAGLINFLLYGVNKTAELVSSILLVMAILYGIIEFLVCYRRKLRNAKEGKHMDSPESTEEITQRVPSPNRVERSITDFDTLEIKIPTTLYKGVMIPFWLSSSANQNLKTERVDLSATDAAMLYFLGKEVNEGGKSWLVSPADHPKLLKEILDKFSDSLEPRLKQELAGHKYPTRNSWVFGSGNTRSRCASRIHKALWKQATIKKARGDRHGPLLFPCSTKTQLGGFHLLPTIKHFNPLST